MSDTCQHWLFFLLSAGHYLAHSISEKFGDRNTLIFCALLSPILILLSASQLGLVAGILFMMSSLFYGLRNPVIHHLLNLEVTSRNRATVMSASTFMGQLGFAIFAPIIGYLADLYTIDTAFMISALMLFAVPVLFMFLRVKKIDILIKNTP
ncbi:MAG: MFS transporter [Nanohaloarchaea archaeon]|nr:MFS transporter [Candidatus Nanohaloarchaea archaeon]